MIDAGVKGREVSRLPCPKQRVGGCLRSYERAYTRIPVHRVLRFEPGTWGQGRHVRLPVHRVLRFEPGMPKHPSNCPNLPNSHMDSHAFPPEPVSAGSVYPLPCHPWAPPSETPESRAARGNPADPGIAICRHFSPPALRFDLFKLRGGLETAFHKL